MEVSPVAQSDFGPAVSMLRNAGIFIACHLSGVLLAGISIRMAGMPRQYWLNLWIIAGAGYVLSYRFVTRQRRVFSSSEKWKLIVCCSLYLTAFEVYAYWGVLAEIHDASLVTMGCLIDLAAIVLLFEFGAPHVMREYLRE